MQRITKFSFCLIICVVVVQVYCDVEELDNNILDHKGHYCKPNLCKIWNGTDDYFVPHIGCNNDGKFGPNCPSDVTMIDMTQRRIDLLLDMHNIARNRIALGEVPGYEPAANMSVLKWDAELQYLAGLNAKRCQFAHDQCRNTDRYEISGQNVGISWQKPHFHSNSKRMKLIVGLWFNEHKDANQTFIDEFEEHPQGKKIGHFTLMVADRVTRVGCAATRYSTEARGRALYIVCNYDYNNIYGEPIYQSGPAASSCRSRRFRSARFPGLCDFDAYYDESEESSEFDGNLIDVTQLL